MAVPSIADFMILGVVYASVAMPASRGYETLDEAVNLLLHSISEGSPPRELWRLRYQQTTSSKEGSAAPAEDGNSSLSRPNRQTIVFPTPSADPVFDDSILPVVKQVWCEILGSEAKDFLDFPERGDESVDG